MIIIIVMHLPWGMPFNGFAALKLHVHVGTVRMQSRREVVSYLHSMYMYIYPVEK